MEVQQQKIGYKNLRPEQAPEEITEDKHPLTYSLLVENLPIIPRKKEDTYYPHFVKEFYFVEEDFNKYKAELTNPDYMYDGIHIYLNDALTPAITIIKMF